MNKFTQILVAAGLVLGSPALVEASVRVASDGYSTSWDAPMVTSQATVNIVYVDDQKQLLALFNEKGGTMKPQEDGWSVDSVPPSPKLYAFSTVSLKNHTCTIYTINPKRSYQPQFIGHELMHCFHGAWHN